MGYKKILAAVDYSVLGQCVFQQALDLAKLNQAHLLLFHCLAADTVVGPPPLSGELGIAHGVVGQTYQAQQAHIEQQMRYIQTLLKHYCNLAIREGIVTEFDYGGADAGTGICQTAQRWDADLIVMGRRGRKGLAEAILGSVSNYVLHHAGCPVLVVQGERLQPTDDMSDRLSSLQTSQRSSE